MEVGRFDENIRRFASPDASGLARRYARTNLGIVSNNVRNVLTEYHHKINPILTCAFAPHMFYCQP